MALKKYDLTGNNDLDAMRYLTSWSDEITFGFANSLDDYREANYTPNPVDGSYDFAELTSQQKQYVQVAFANFNEFTTVGATFVSNVNSSNADIRLANSSYVDDYPASGIGYNPDGDFLAGSVFFRMSALTDQSGELQSNYLHEIGHALGLKHPAEISWDDDSNENLVELPKTTAADIQGRTVMGYGITNNITFMPYDILALQSFYGVDTETRKTNTVYEVQRVSGGFEITAGGESYLNLKDTQAATIWDANGTDKIDLSSLDEGVDCDLNPGMGVVLGVSHLLDSFGNDRDVGFHIYFPFKSTGANNLIENATGSNFVDRMVGNAVSNSIFGLAGNDTLYGMVGNDKLYGEADSDTLFGGKGNDTISGGIGNDYLYGEQGADYLSGGTGTDRAAYNTSASGVIVSLANPSINKGDALGDTYNSIENITGSKFNDSLFGNSGANAINSGSGDDLLKGYSGNDTLTGGAGKDVFIFNTALNSSSNFDKITDFTVSDDTIWLENAFFTAFTSSGVLAKSAFAANLSGNAGDGSDRIIYETDTGELYYDADGTGSVGAILFAKISRGLSLSNTDFVII